MKINIDYQHFTNGDSPKKTFCIRLDITDPNAADTAIMKSGLRLEQPSAGLSQESGLLLQKKRTTVIITVEI